MEYLIILKTKEVMINSYTTMVRLKELSAPGEFHYSLKEYK